LYKLNERDDVLFDFADLNPGWAYVALGHVHKPQKVNGQANVRYSGSLERLDFGETHSDHGVLLVDIGPTGLSGDPVPLPIPATPFHTIEMTDPSAELPSLADRYPDHETAIVRVTVSTATAGLSRDEIAREVRRLFPRLYELNWTEANSPGEIDVAATFTPRAGLASTVHEYLAARLADDLDREDVLALANHFLEERGEA
jgi:exonuclease SbcD